MSVKLSVLKEHHRSSLLCFHCNCKHTLSNTVQVFQLQKGVLAAVPKQEALPDTLSSAFFLFCLIQKALSLIHDVLVSFCVVNSCLVSCLVSFCLAPCQNHMKILWSQVSWQAMYRLGGVVGFAMW